MHAWSGLFGFGSDTQYKPFGLFCIFSDSVCTKSILVQQIHNANFGCIQPAGVAAVAIDHGFGSPDDIRNLGAFFSLNGEFHDSLAIRQQVSENSCYLALEPAMPRMGWRHHDLIKPIELNFERK